MHSHGLPGRFCFFFLPISPNAKKEKLLWKVDRPQKGPHLTAVPENGGDRTQGTLRMVSFCIPPSPLPSHVSHASKRIRCRLLFSPFFSPTTWLVSTFVVNLFLSFCISLDPRARMCYYLFSRECGARIFFFFFLRVCLGG